MRVDSIEQAIRASALAPVHSEDAGYRVAIAIAYDNLSLGLNVIADSVNPWMLTRDAWRDAGRRAGADVLEIEIVCLDQAEHRTRVETRSPSVPGLIAPDWKAVIERDYRPWDRARLVIQTSGRAPGACVDELLAAAQGADASGDGGDRLQSMRRAAMVDASPGALLMDTDPPAPLRRRAIKVAR